MKKFSLMLAVFGITFCVANNAFAQTITSAQPGPWNDNLTWVGGVIPDASNSDFIVVDHNITIPSGFSAIVDGTTISAGVSLTVNSGGILSVGAGADAVLVDGTLEAANTSSITGTDGTNLRISSTGTFIHSFTTTQGILPLATWDPSSILQISGYTTFTTATAGGNWGQNFDRVIWNCLAQTSTVNLAGLLTSIGGDFEVQSTGTGFLQLSATQNPTISIGGNLEISGTSRVTFATTGIAPGAIVNITDDFIFTSTNAGTGTRLVTTGVCTINIGRDLLINAVGGVLNLSSGTAGSGTLNITGNFALTNGTLTESGGTTSTGFINFLNTATEHTFDNTGTISNRIAYSVAATNTLRVSGESQVVGNANSSLSVLGNLIVESTDAAGAIQTGSGAGATTGNIRVVTRTYDANSTVTYGATSAQFLGNGQAGIAGTTIIDNAAGASVVATTTVTVSGDIILQTGNLNVSNASMNINGDISLDGGDLNFTSTGSARTVNMLGNIALNGGEIIVTSGTANANLIIAGDITGSNFISFSGVNSNLTINGTGALSTDFPLSGPTDIEAITVNRTGATVVFAEDITATDVTATLGNIDMNANLILTRYLNLATGTTLFFEDQTLELRSQFNNTSSGGLLSSNSSSILNITNTGIVGTLAFSPSGNTLGTFSLNRVTGGNLVTLNSTLTITSVFDLLDGIFVNTSGLNLGSGAVFTRNTAASITGAIPTGGAYDLMYTGTGLTTGVEAQGLLANVTSTSSGTVILNAALVASGTLDINSGTFSSGANTISVGALTNSGILNAPTTTLTIDGVFTNNGTFNRISGTVLFTGTSSIAGSTNPTFQNLTISSGTFTAPTTLNLNGAFTNNGTFNAGAGTVAFLGTAGVTQLVSGTSVTDFNNISVSNTTANPDVQIQSNQNLIGVLTLGATATFDADGSANTSVFTLKSTSDSPTADASIATLPAGAQVTGNVTVERFMAIEGPDGGRIYRYISSPVQNAPVSDMQVEIPVTGSFTGTSICATCSTIQTMFLYNETVITDTNGNAVNDFNDGYEDFPANANTETFAAGRGYAMFVRGNLLTGNALWNLRGPINQGNVTPVNFSPTFASSGVPANDGWNLVGNPYPSTIDWNAAAGWTKTNISAAIQIRDNLTGVFATWNGIAGTNGGSQFIATGQAFWIQTTGAPTLTANENIKVAGTQTTFFKKAALTDILRITMVKDALRDETVIHFREDAQAGFDPGTDARKFANSIFNLSSVLNTGEVLAINSAPFSCSESVKLSVTNAAVGTYQLEFSQLESFSGDVLINLTDKFLNQTVEISSTTPPYTFSITSNPASTGTDRFTVAFSAKALAEEMILSSTPVCENERAVVSIQNSETYAHYQVLKDGVALSEPMVGNGSALDLLLYKDSLDAGVNTIGIEAVGNRCLNTKMYPGSIVVNEMSTTEAIEGSTCKEGSIKLTAVGSAGTTGFRWYDAQDSETVLSTESEFTTPVISKSRTYYVSGINTSGCISDRVPVAANVIQYEDVTITETEAGVLESNYTIGNKWFLNDVEMTGETSSTISPKESGIYKVEVIQEGCSSTAEYNVLVITGTEDMNALNGISIYPNPVTDKAYIDVLENKVDIRKAVLYYNMGNAIYDIMLVKEGEHKRGVVDMNNLPSGVYVVRLFTPTQIVTLKVLKK